MGWNPATEQGMGVPSSETEGGHGGIARAAYPIGSRTFFYQTSRGAAKVEA